MKNNRSYKLNKGQLEKKSDSGIADDNFKGIYLIFTNVGLINTLTKKNLHSCMVFHGSIFL